MSNTLTQIVQPIPYLSFDGNCGEAVRFYEKVLRGDITVLMTNGESPVADHFPKEMHNRIINATLALPGGGMLMAGDAPGHAPYEGIKGVSLALNYPTTEEAEKVLNALSEGGTVDMPFSPTFWAEKFGRVTDKFGVTWLVNGNPTAV